MGEGEGGGVMLLCKTCEFHHTVARMSFCIHPLAPLDPVKGIRVVPCHAMRHTLCGFYGDLHFGSWSVPFEEMRPS